MRRPATASARPSASKRNIASNEASFSNELSASVGKGRNKTVKVARGRSWGPLTIAGVNTEPPYAAPSEVSVRAPVSPLSVWIPSDLRKLPRPNDQQGRDDPDQHEGHRLSRSEQAPATRPWAS